MKPFNIIIFSLLISILILTSCDTSDKKHPSEDLYVVMLSLDGFRWDYADMYPTPNLDKIAKNGVKAHSLIPSFPTKTFPNHYTIVSGLYPDHHGIVNNSFYDPDWNKYYAIRNREAVEDGKFYGGEPIWVTAENQGVVSASFFWVGSEADIKGVQPTYWKKYEHSFPFEQRIDTVIYWLSLPEEKRPHLITFYMDEPDSQGHKTGPISEGMKQTIQYLDSLVGVFIYKVEQLPIHNKINIIITSDHGMCPVAPDRVTYLKDWLQAEWLDTIQGSDPVYNILANEGYIDTVYFALKKADHITVWKPNEVPERLHYGTNPRVLDLIVVADSSWGVRWKPGKYGYQNGSHGFDNNNTDMHTIFYGMGPAFKTNYVQPSFENVNIYVLLAHMLQLEPKQTDGNLDHVRGMLAE
jgi:alkaline phosphatase D